MNNMINKVITIVAVMMLLISSNYFGKKTWSSFVAAQSINKIAELYTPPTPEMDSAFNSAGILRAFEPLLAQNPDTIGWLRIPGAKVNQVVVQRSGGDEDFYYLHTDFNHKPSKHGALFLSGDNILEKDNTSKNLTVHGHHMKDDLMFGLMKNFRELDFYKENPLVYFDTLYGAGTYKIFAVMLTNAEPGDDAGEVFYYTKPDFQYEDGSFDEEEFMKYIDELRKRSMHNIPVDVDENDEILTLSTCEYDFPSARLVVIARKVRDGEDTEVDTAKAEKNPTVLYPQAWYNRYGGQKPTF